MAKVQFLTYYDKKYPIKLGHYSLRLFQQEHNASIAEAQEDMRLFQHLLFLALNQGARIEKQELDLELEDMVDMLDECMIDFALAIPKFYPSKEDIPEELKDELAKLQEEGGTQTDTSTTTKSKRKRSSK